MIYFITICVADRRPVPANDYAFAAFKNAAAKLDDWMLLAAVLMPDHLHILVAPTKDRNAKVGNFTAAIKRWMRQEIQKNGNRCGRPTRPKWRWQPGCFDRLLRFDESLRDKWLYVEENPVRAGLARQYSEWPYRYISSGIDQLRRNL